MRAGHCAPGWNVTSMKDIEHPIPVRIAYVGGGSLNWAPTLMADLAHDTRLDAEVRLYDLDPAAAERNARMGGRYAEVSNGTPARYRAVPSPREALEGADVVVVSILPGRFDDMAQDIGIPARYGIPQAVGDTVGPGGFVRAMRAIPMLAEIARAIGEHAPNAWVCNLTNPMSVLTGALHAAFPGIRAWGECHEVTKIRRQVAGIANADAGSDRWSFRDVEVNVLGINHFTFVDAISLGGRDMLPAYRAFAAANASGVNETVPGEDAEHDRYFGSKCLVKFDLYDRFGIPGAAGDRHLAEFLPVGDYLADPGRWGFGLTPVEYRTRDQARRRARAEALAAGEIAPVAKRSDEALIDQIVALAGGGTFVSNVNLPNRGQLAGIPEGAIVETNALFSGLGITPLVAGHLPEGLHDIIADHAARQSALLQAVMAGEGGALFPLFHEDPLVRHMPETEARRMFGEMIAATSAWLPENLKGAA
ncbi:alpha-galacturonidase [Allosediminivita pacifica]|uniref:Alpha-galactosidase n=2 Tax=Allosediminivita pacifica TaxID=1267769 RepID=A0A2T6AQ09_9RHOB|nr:alpha-galactosidase [Allosediminivita pacifica]GGB19319.1 alpha-galacturonidase [Allosediminivita pacifica]